MDTRKVSFLKKFIKVALFEGDRVTKAKTDEKMLMELWEENRPFFINILNKYNISYDDREDLLQEFWFVFSKAVQKYDATAGKFSSYLYKILDNKTKDIIMDKKDIDSNEVDIQHDINDEGKDTLENVIEHNEDHDVSLTIEDIKKKIPDARTKKVVDLLEQGYQQNEIAEEIMVSPEYVRQLIQNKIKPLFQKELGEFKFARETWTVDNGQYKVAEVVIDDYAKVVDDNTFMLNTVKTANIITRFVSQREGLLDIAITNKVSNLEETLRCGEMKVTRRNASMEKVSYVEKVHGHKNSKGELAEWVIKSEKDDKIISSHATKEQADKHVKQINWFRHKGSSDSVIRVHDLKKYADMDITNCNHSCFECIHFMVDRTDAENQKILCEVSDDVIEKHGEQLLSQWITLHNETNGCEFYKHGEDKE